MKFKVNAPHGEITIGMRFGAVTFKNGQIVDQSEATQLFPEYFIPVKSETVLKKDTNVIQNETVEQHVKTEQPTEKRKAGRPKKIPFAKG